MSHPEWPIVRLAPFVLDRIDNPHPDLLADALRTRARARNREWDEVAAAEWRGLRRGMARATGCAEHEIEAWLDRPRPDARKA